MRVCLMPLIWLITLGLPGWVSAHEFWIEPQNYQINPGDPIVAQLKTGEFFEGADHSYIRSSFKRFDLVMGDRAIPITGRDGDFPPIDISPAGSGLAVLVQVSNGDTQTYDQWDDFVTFAKAEFLDGLLDRHLARGLSKTEIVEQYVRYAKSMVAVGDGAGADRALGLRLEFIAEANPYVHVPAEGLPVRLMFEGRPLTETLVVVFEKAGLRDARTLKLKTDGAGRIHVPVKRGHSYLVDAVLPLPLDRPGAHWQTLWATLSFRVPD